MLLSSHHLSEVEQMCSHVLVMNHGRLVASGTVSELIGVAGSVYVEVDDRAAARAVLADRAGRASRVHVQGDGLVVDLRRRPALRSRRRRSWRAGLRLETIMPTQRLEDAFLDLLATSVGDARPRPVEVHVVIALVRTEFVKAARRTRTLVIALRAGRRCRR